MPTVPRFDTPQVEQNTQPMVAMDAPRFQTNAFDVAKEANAGAMRMGDTLSKAALDAQNEANDLRVMDATNQAKERMFDLLYHKDTGALSQKGIAALERPSGMPLADEYADSFKKVSAGIAGTLGNDQQRRKFMEQAGAMNAQMYGTVLHHQSNEFKTYQGSVYDGTIKTGQNEIAMAGVTGNIIKNNETGETNVDAAANNVRAAVKAKARLMGFSQTQADEEAAAAVSGGHENAIKGLLDQKNGAAAMSYFATYKKDMTAKDILGVQTQITNLVRQQTVTVAATGVDRELAPRFAPDDMTRLHGIVMQMESGGQRYAAGGKLLESGKGAKGEMQVLDGTNRDPGFGVTPAKDDSPEERARVGRDYLDAMIKRYGRIDQALAAYNAGPGTVDAAIAKAKNPKNDTGGDWLTEMPTETKKYVQKGMVMYSSGDGAAPKPTERDYVQSVVSRLGPNADPELVRMGTEEAKRRYSLLDQDAKQREENAIASAQRLLLENGGNFNSLPASVVSQLPPGKRPEIEEYASKVRNPKTDTDWGRYADLNALRVAAPEKFAQLDLSLYKPFFAPDQFKTMLDHQLALKDPTKQFQARTFDQQLSEAHGALKIDSKSDAEKRAKFDDVVARDVAAESKGRGRELTYEERDKIIKRNMLQTSAGWFGGKRVYEVSGTPVEGTSTVKIPDDDRKLIIASLGRIGVPATEENIRKKFNNRYGIN